MRKKFNLLSPHNICLVQNSIHAETQSGRIVAWWVLLKKVKLDSENEFRIEIENDKTFFFRCKINQTFLNSYAEVKSKTTVVKIESEGCQISFHLIPNLTIMVSVLTNPKFGLKWFPQTDG